MSDPLEVEVVSIDGAPPQPKQEAPPEPEQPWFRFDRSFARPKSGSSFLTRLLGGMLAVTLLLLGLFALALFLGFQLVRSIARAIFPGSPPPSQLSPRR